VPGFKAAFACFNNPVVAWTGLLSVVILAVQTVRRRCGKALFLLVGYLSQLLPWFAIGRITFAYHYFPSTLFLVLAISYAMNDMMERKVGRWQWAVYGMTAFRGPLRRLLPRSHRADGASCIPPASWVIPGGAWPF
jgi:dolichyl-phosphate-mannose--protein O-mannosyl transferase